MTRPNFQTQQYRFTAYLRDPANTPVPGDIEPRRINVYRELVYNNLESFISNSFPVIRSIYSDDNWHRMVRDFLARHECHTPYFLEISREFIDYLENEREPQPEDPAGLVELAHYERVELVLDIAEDEVDMETIDANGNLLEGRPVVSPLAMSLVYEYPVHKMGPGYLPEEAPETPTCLVVYRNRHDDVKFLEINPVTTRLIHIINENTALTGYAALRQIATEMNHPEPETVINGGLYTLQELQQLSVILGIQR